MLLQPNLGLGVTSDPGADFYSILGPVPASGVLGNTVLPLASRLGDAVTGNLGSEFVFCKITLAATTDLLPGAAFQVDKDYNASLVTTALAVMQSEVMFGQFWAPALAAGVYYAWLGRAGHLAVQVTGTPAAGGIGETTTTAGKLGFPAAATSTSKAATPSSLYAANATFTANTTNGSPTLSGIPSVLDIAVGAAIAGTGIPASTVIGAIRRSGGTYLVDMVQSAALRTPQNATANGTAITVTATGALVANVAWPTLNKTNP